MNNEAFLQHLRDLSLEEGRIFIEEHAAELEEHAGFGNFLADEALRLLYSPFASLKLAELLIYFGEYVHHALSLAHGLKAKGNALRYIGHEQAALECLDAAGKEYLLLGDEVGWARTRISWILACAWLGHVDEALQEAVRAREVFERHNENYWICIIDSNTAIIYDHVGRHQDALALYERTRVIYPTLTDQGENYIKRAIGIAEVNEAICLAWLGKFEQAYDLQQKAQASFIELEEMTLAINSEIHLADLDYIQGYYGSALRRYYHARDSVIQNSIDDPLLLVDLKFWMANCLVKLNRMQEACQLAEEAVEAYRKLGTAFTASNALREYASILVASGRLREALAVLVEVQELLGRSGFDYFVSITRLQQAELLLEMESVTEAYEQARLIKEYFETKGIVSCSVRARLVMATALIESVQRKEVRLEDQLLSLQEATMLCEQAASIARQHNLREQVYKSQYLLGRLARIQRNLGNAARHYRIAIDQIERILNDLVYDLSPSFLQTAWMVYEDMIALCLERGQKERAFSYLERARSMALRQYLNKAKTSVGGIGEQLDSSEAQGNSAEMLRTRYELKAWQEKYHDYSSLLAEFDPSVSPAIDREVIQAELKHCEAKLSELFERLHLYELDMPTKAPTSRSKKQAQTKRTVRSIQGLNIPQLQQCLAPDQVLLAYFLYKGKLVIFVITAERLVIHENSDGVATLEYLLLLLHQVHLQPGGWPNIQQPPQQVVRRLLKKLYDLLIAPIASLLPPASGYLTIIPYGPLHTLPFHALYDGSHFLIEDFQISYLPTSNMLLNLGTRTEKELNHHLSNGPSQSPTPRYQTGVSEKSPLIMAYSENGHLQRALDEAKALAALLDGRCYLEAEATIARLGEEAPGSPIIHLATHGRGRMDAPHFSSVSLADGQFNAIDAFSLNLRDCELVTLSGCETGLALNGGGDEQLGLGRAFLAAGAASLVMSLWSVEDSATNELMQLFYHNLLRGETKVQALRAAQCSLIQGTSSTYTHPYFWAAFRLVGETGTLTCSKAKEQALMPEIELLKI